MAGRFQPLIGNRLGKQPGGNAVPRPAQEHPWLEHTLRRTLMPGPARQQGAEHSPPGPHQGDAKAAHPAPLNGVRLVSLDEALSPEFLSQWQNLTDHCAEPNPFYEPWFLLPSLGTAAHRLSALPNLFSLPNNAGLAPSALLNTQPKGQRLSAEAKLFCLFDGGALQALIPLARRKNYYGHSLPHITNWLHSNMFCGAPLVLAEAGEAFWSALLRFADSQPGSGAFLHLAELPAAGESAEALRKVMAREGRKGAVVDQAERAALNSPLGEQDYFAAALSAKKRKELRRQLRRLKEEGEVAFERLNDTTAIGTWCEQFLALEAAGWKGAEGSALASMDTTAALFRTIMAEGAKSGRVERLSLTLDARPIAMLANFLCPPAAYSFKTAYDEAYSRFSPGVLLQRYNLALLERPDIRWADSCAREGHPMIERIWRERRRIFSINIAIGGHLRRAAFHYLARYETGAPPGAI